MGGASLAGCHGSGRPLSLPVLSHADVCGRVELKEPSLGELARVIKAGACIEASFKRGKGEAGMDEYQVRTWQGWHHHMALTLIAVWFLIGETHRGQQLTPALTLPQVRYGLSVLLLEVYCTPGIDYICRQVYRQLLRNELARFYHHRTRKCIPPRKLRRDHTVGIRRGWKSCSFGHGVFTLGHHSRHRFGRPLKRMGTFIPFGHKGHQALRQVLFVRKISNAQTFAL